MISKSFFCFTFILFIFRIKKSFLKHQKKVDPCYYSRKKIWKRVFKTGFYLEKNIENLVKVSTKFLKTYSRTWSPLALFCRKSVAEKRRFGREFNFNKL